MPVDVSTMEDRVAKIEKSYKNKVFKGSDYDNPERIPFESPVLNWASGGGVPQGRFTRIFGHWSAGKSRTTWGVIAEAQRMGKKCIYYNIEKQYNIGHAEEVGVDVDELEVIQTSRIEEVGAICEELLNSAHVHVFDSCSAASSIDALGADVEDWQRGLKARAWNKVMDRLTDKIDDVENTIIYIDQVRVNQQTHQEEPPGGKAMEHDSSLTIQLRRAKWLFRNNKGNLTDDSKGTRASNTFSRSMEPDGIEIVARVVKSRVGRPNRTALMRLDYRDMMFDKAFEIARAGVDLGIIDQKGAWYYVDAGRSKPEKFNGIDNLQLYVAEDADLQEEIMQHLLKSNR